MGRARKGNAQMGRADGSASSRERRMGCTRRWFANGEWVGFANGEWVGFANGEWVAQMGRADGSGSRTEKETDGVATEKETDGVRDGEEVAADERYHAVDSPAWRESRVI
ncbi:hypothetical protein Adt_41007 [Abeliophyllum distichum]|uniref:Uncharacterized protein n=1 Tax=Abeliophyllum distichum TaxID=126358 RepID=A0ABD1PML7_9LAMI